MSKARLFSKEGARPAQRGGKKRSAEQGRINKRKSEGFEPLTWIDPTSGRRVKLSQMGRRATK